MTVTIDATYARAYEQNMLVLAQQSVSRLEGAVRVKRGVKGKSTTFPVIGVRAAPPEVTSRFADSPHNDSAYTARTVYPHKYADGEMIDDFDTMQMLADPSSDVSNGIRMAFERWKDALIVDAALGTTYTGENGTGTSTFLAANIIALNAHLMDHESQTAYTSGNAPLTPGKINAAIGLLGQNEADMADAGGRPTVYCYCSSKQLAAMRRHIAYTNDQYQKSLLPDLDNLIGAKSNMFMGVQFIRGEQFNVDATPSEQVILWHRDAIGLAYWDDVTATMAPRPDKQFVPYWFFRMSVGAGRIEDNRIIQILCTQPSLIA